MINLRRDLLTENDPSISKLMAKLGEGKSRKQKTEHICMRCNSHSLKLTKNKLVPRILQINSSNIMHPM